MPLPHALNRRPSVVALVTLLAVLCTLAVPVTTGAAASAATPAPARKVTAWLPWWDQARAYESFLRNADLYSSVSPFWYEMSSTGGVVGYPGAGEVRIVTGIRSAGVRVVPTITNDFDPVRVGAMLSTARKRTAHVKVLTALAAARNYDGLDIDYENLAATDRNRYSAFITELAAALHRSGRILTVAVHPKTSEPGSWSGPQAQDYAALGKAADRLRVMAYDYSWATSPAGPVAPIAWVADVAAFAARTVGPAKVELGVPLYGYDWVGNRGAGLTHESAVQLMRTHGATRTWNEAAAEASFTYSAGGASHTVWYSDAASVSARLALVDRYGLSGVAFWRLGGEDPAVWSAVRSRWPAPAR